MKKVRNRFVGVMLLAVLLVVFSLPKVPYLPNKYQSYLDKFKINLGLDLQGGLHLEYEMDLAQISDDKKKEAIEAVQSVVERRVNAYGVGESVVQHAKREEKDFLIVEIPGATNVDDIKNVIDKTPFLQFREEKTAEELKEDEKILAPYNEQTKKTAQETLDKIVKGENFDDIYKEQNKKNGLEISDEELQFIGKGSLSAELEKVVFSTDLAIGQVHQNLIETDSGYFIIKKLEVQGEGEEQKVKIKNLSFGKVSPAMIPDFKYKPTELDGKHLERANFSYYKKDEIGIAEPVVNLNFNDEGKKLFGELTKRSIGKTIAIYLDDEPVSIAGVEEEIISGSPFIEGNFSKDEAKELAKSLNEGALPVPIKLVSQQSIGASLGKEALAMSLRTGLYGLIFTMIYMIFYYRILGLVSAVGLVIYGSILIAIFKFSSVLPQGMAITMTLSGIAGLILSIGMAVDANILIFERIKEELKLGKSLKRAVEEGFGRAWSSIQDGNYSTILTALILMMIGTGFVKGFALNLIIGVLFSMFTAVVLVRIMVEFIARGWLENNLWLIFGFRKKVDLEENKKEKKYWGIINKRSWMYGFSSVLLVVSIFALVKWNLKLGIDFLGGTLTEYKFSDGVEIPNSEQFCQSLGECNESFSLQKSDNNHLIIRYRQADEEFNKKVVATVKKFDEKAEQIRTDFIGATISDQLKGGTMKAIFWSVILIMFYVAWAFRKISQPVSAWYYGLGAIIALVHDIVVTLGIFAFLGHFYNVEIGVPFVAAMLTILGYSVNDSIVVFDRVRENVLHMKKGEGFLDLLNRSLNETLVRSLNTSSTVIVSLLIIVVFGGESLQSFSLALLIGIVSGTYSSIFIATAFVASVYKFKSKKNKI